MARFADLAPRLTESLRAASRLEVDLQPCIRDVWHDHILFTGEKVTGIVDFGSLRNDTVAGDLARLLPSLVAGDAEQRAFALEAYERLRPLSADEHQLLRVFEQVSPLLAGMNWLRWICVERRSFENPERILPRVDEILRQLAGSPGRLEL